MSVKVPSFCVIGSGIIGLSSAYCLARRFQGCRITVVADEFFPHSCSKHSFGICSVRGLDKIDGAETVRWTKSTIGYIRNIISQKSPELVSEMGITPVNAYLTYLKQDFQNKDKINVFVPDTFSFHRQLGGDEIHSLGYRERDLGRVFEKDSVSEDDVVVFKAGTWIIDNHSYLPWLRKEIELMEARGQISQVRFVRKSLRDFSQAFDEDYDCIVNCTGLGSEYLVPDDKVVPIRGQYLVAEQMEDVDLRYARHTYVCPKAGRVMLGGVFQIGRRDIAVDPRDSEDIMRRCYALNPRIASWKIIKEDVGIRPGRYGGPRVELEMRRMESLARSVPVLHNYGHGARGVMMHWGCALDVVKLAENALAIASRL